MKVTVIPQNLVIKIKP